ncbi:MAG: HEAT repeat domain-containing protein [Deltaproteobacteria bacterium]|nr:HEAT repeat domain-containing protein [Deltaproteobacteria bacterium]
MSRAWHVKAMMVGLGVTQALATLHVYLSDRALFSTLQSARRAGYLTVPNEIIAPTLTQWGPACLGGCFFTLTLGAGLSVFALVIAWTWIRLLGRHTGRLAVLAGCWAVVVVMVNAAGFSLIVSAYFLIVPVAVFTAAVRWIAAEPDRNVWLRRLTPVVPLLALSVIWTATADRFLFMDIRDFLLLSNPVGQKVDRFYYRYTLYAAQVFKTLEQQTLKTCYIHPRNHMHLDRLQSILIQHDYLPVGASDAVDVEVVALRDSLTLKHQGRVVMQVSWADFIAHPEQVLRGFSNNTDRYGPFRLAALLGLLVGFPVLLYIFIFTLIQAGCGLLWDPSRSGVLAAGVCLAVGLALLMPLRVGRSRVVPPERVSEALSASSWRQRVSALRSLVDNHMEIGRFAGYRRMLASTHVPERYWLAKALGASRMPDTFSALMVLLDDAYPDVVSMAFFSLGRRGDKQIISEILNRITTSDHWYNQWYAYRALRALGWKNCGTKPSEKDPNRLPGLE